MDSSRGVMSGTMDRFKMVHELDMLYYVAVIYIHIYIYILPHLFDYG